MKRAGGCALLFDALAHAQKFVAQQRLGDVVLVGHAVEALGKVGSGCAWARGQHAGGSSAQKRDVFPGRGLFVMVFLEGVVAGHEQALRTRGAQAGIDRIETPFIEQRTEGANQTLGQSGEPLLVLHARTRRALALIEKDEFQIRPVAHLACATTAQHQDGQLGVGAGVTGRQIRGNPARRFPQACFGQPGELRRDFFVREIAGHVMHADAQDLLGLKAAHAAQGRLVVAAGQAGGELVLPLGRLRHGLA